MSSQVVHFYKATEKKWQHFKLSEIANKQYEMCMQLKEIYDVYFNTQLRFLKFLPNQT